VTGSGTGACAQQKTETISEKGTIHKLGFVNGNLDITCLSLADYRPYDRLDGAGDVVT
jgi:hypothetical protein